MSPVDLEALPYQIPKLYQPCQERKVVSKVDSTKEPKELISEATLKGGGGAFQSLGFRVGVVAGS